MGGVLLREWDPAPRQLLANDYKLSLSTLYQWVFQSESARLAGLGEISEEEHWAWVGNQAGVRPDDLIEFRKRFWSGDRIDSEITGFITNLRQHYQTALLSNAWSGTRRVLDEYYNCLGLFHHVIISAEVKLVKPDPAIYTMMLNRLEVEPHESIFIDDLSENIAAANQLGIHGIRFETPIQAMGEVRALLQ